MSIVINNSKNVFLLQTVSNSYAFGIDDQGLVRHLYWGKRIETVEDFEMPVLTEVSTNDPVYEITPEEFPVYGSLRYKEHCLKVTFADGTREVVYEYVGYQIEKTEAYDELILELKDQYYALKIELHYKVYEKYDLMERFVVIHNESNEAMEVEQLQSGQFHIPYEDLNFTNVHGHWGAEQQRFVQKVSYGKILIENRRGISSHNHNPYFILDKDATETSGDVYFGALRRTGNFSGVVEQTPYGETLVQLGLNAASFSSYGSNADKIAAGIAIVIAVSIPFPVVIANAVPRTEPTIISGGIEAPIACIPINISSSWNPIITPVGISPSTIPTRAPSTSGLPNIAVPIK